MMQVANVFLANLRCLNFTFHCLQNQFTVTGGTNNQIALIYSEMLNSKEMSCLGASLSGQIFNVLTTKTAVFHWDRLQAMNS